MTLRQVGCAAIQARLEAKPLNRRPVASLSGCSLSGHLRRPHSLHSPGPQQRLSLARVSSQTLLAAILQHCVCGMYLRFMCSQARQVDTVSQDMCSIYANPMPKLVASNSLLNQEAFCLGKEQQPVSSWLETVCCCHGISAFAMCKVPVHLLELLQSSESCLPCRWAAGH